VPRRRTVAEPTRIYFHKGDGTRYRSTLHRPDGAVIALEGGSWNRIGGPVTRVPHDLAHLVVEQGLGLERGLWGVLAAGGLVQNAAYAGGRRPPHAIERAKRITDAAGEELRRAEGLVRAIADATRTSGRVDIDVLRGAIGPRWWRSALTADAFDAIASGLRDAAVAWDGLPPGSALERTWGDGRRLVAAP
jgi:hypothetical protein